MRKNYLPKEEGRRVEKKSPRSAPEGPGLEPGTYRVLGEGPQLHATVRVNTNLIFNFIKKKKKKRDK